MAVHKLIWPHSTRDGGGSEGIPPPENISLLRCIFSIFQPINLDNLELNVKCIFSWQKPKNGLNLYLLAILNASVVLNHFQA